MHVNTQLILATFVVILSVTLKSSQAAEENGTKPVVFLSSPLSSPPYSNSSLDNGNSESRVDTKITTEEQSAPSEKKSVSSHGYQLEEIDDDTEEAQERAGSENLKPQLGGLYGTNVVDQTSSLLNQFLHSDYEENSGNGKEDFLVSKEKISYGNLQPKADISKVRDLFVDKEVGAGKASSPHATSSYPSSAPLESKYYETPYGNNGPIVLKSPSIPLIEPSPVSAPVHHPPHGLISHEVTGHTAGYGHGFHHHQQKLKAKPLKPSVVYRDPSDRFDHHDKIRTLDKDHLGGVEKDSRHPYGPHVIGKNGFHDYHHEKKVIFEPTYYYDQTKVPECAHKNKYIYNVTFCLDDPHYPVETIIWALKESGHHGKKLLSDVTYQSADNLVTGLTRAEEEGYTYRHYFGATHAQNDHLDKYKPPYAGYTYSTDYFKKGGYICPSDIYYARPKRAMNTFGKWKVIVNVDHVPDHGYDKHGYGHHGHNHGHFDKGHGHYEKVHGHGHYEKDHGHFDKGHHHEHGHGHYEKSHEHGHGHHEKGHEFDHGHGLYGKEHRGLHHDEHHHAYGPEHHSIKKREYKEPIKSKAYTQTLRLEQCIYSNAPCSYIDSHIHSRCIQKHNFVRLLAWTKEEGLHVDTFKLPIACSCHVRQPIHFYHESGHHEHKHGHVVPPVNSYHGHGHPHHDHHGEHHHDVLKKVY